MMFSWDTIQYRDDGKVLLLWRHERVFEEGLIKDDDRVLDVGGWGHFNDRVEQEGACCTIMDTFGPDQYYRERILDWGDWLNCSILDPDPIAMYLDHWNVVSIFETLEHVGDARKAIANIYKMLVYAGWIVGTMPIPGHCHFLGEPGIEFLDASELELALRHAGFGNITIEPTGSVTKDEVPSSLYFKAQKL